MQDDELYQRIAVGIEPWTISEIKVESATQRWEVHVECQDTVPKQCPHCDCMLLVCDHGEEQTWRQPDAGPWQIFLKGRLPLIECPEHGLVRVSPPWADWYVRGVDKSLLGPWSLQQLKMLLDAGRISPSTLLKRSTADKWVIAGTVSALFVRQDEAQEPPLSVDELAAVDWAIAQDEIVFDSLEASVSDDIAADIAPSSNAPDGGPSRHFDGDESGSSHKWPRLVRQANQPDVTGVTSVGKSVSPGLPDDDRELRLLEDSDEIRVRDAPPNLKPTHPTVPREPDKRPAAREKPRSSPQSRKPVEPSPSEWDMAVEQAVEMGHTAKIIRKKPADGTAVEPVKTSPRRDALARRRGFQHGYQLLMMVYLVNACLVCCIVPAICMIFFSRLLLLSTSVFAPFEGGNDLQEGQLVECGLSALCLLVLIAFPVWHLKSNDGAMWHYVPSALVGMTIGFGLPPAYLDDACAALQWCEFILGVATVGLTVYTLSAVPARSRMSLPMIVAGLLTTLSALALLLVRPGSMLLVQADAIPPQFRGAVPDAPLYVIGLYGTLILIPAALLFELYRHTDYSTRQLIVRTGLIAGLYLLAGLATLGSFVHGAGAGFFDVPLALLPLGCINALAAALPAVLLLADPNYSITPD